MGVELTDLLKSTTPRSNMKVKGDLNEYSIIGRKLPCAMDPHPKLFRQQIFAPDEVAAKSRFWKFLSYYQKINKKVGEVVECKQVHESHPGCAKNYGIWIRYDSRSTIENMYREYRDISLPLAVTQMYREMAGRHRARPGSIQVLRTKQMNNPNIQFPLPRRIMSKKAQTTRRFAAKRPNTIYIKLIAALFFLIFTLFDKLISIK